MKLLRTYNPYLTKDQWRKVFLAMSIMTIALYIIAMVFSLCGSKYFILNYQNEQMDRIESFMREHNIMGFVTCLFLTLEFSILISFIRKKITNIFYPLGFYVTCIAIAFIFPNANSFVYTGVGLLSTLIIPIVENTIVTKKFDWKILIRYLIAWATSIIFQLMILIIKAGYFDGQNHVLTLSAYFIYSLEYDIALSVILFTVLLYINREKGDSKSWAKFQDHSGSSQISKTQLRKSNTKNLTKTQKNKLRLLIFKIYLIQLGTFLVVMILPFLTGKVFEFLVMYFAFCIVRYILGFNYSLHFKKESLCALVGVIVFGILSLAVPFFYVDIILALTLGTSLAIILHFSYKYKAFYLFNKIARPDKFAELYVLMDADLTPHHVRIICNHRSLDKEETELICDFAEGNKKSYLAKKYNYSEKTIERKINDAIDKLYDNC